MAYARSENGGIINPPIIKEFENRIYAIMEKAPGAVKEIERLHRAYDDARVALVEFEESLEKQDAEDQAVKDADARAAVAQRTAPVDSPRPDSVPDAPVPPVLS